MFNLDEVEFDLDDEIFDISPKRLKSDDFNLQNKGKLSFGVEDLVFDKGAPQLLTQSSMSSPPNILKYINNEKNIKECKQNFLKASKTHVELSPIFQRSNTLFHQDFTQSPSYSPIPSTQKPNNIISNTLFHQDSTQSTSYSPITSTQKPNIIISKALFHQDLTQSPTYSHILSTQKPGNIQGSCLFDKTNSISPIRIKPGLLSGFNKGINVQSCNKPQRFRKFPGPAGYLPNIDQNEGFVNDYQSINKEETYQNLDINRKETFLPSTQQNDSDAWKRAKRNIGVECWHLFENYCLENVFKMITQPNGLPNFKIPVLCLILLEVEYLPRDATGSMSDNTGSIKVAIHRSVLQQYKEKIKVGAVFVLKKVSIFSPSGKKYFLNITQSNVVDIFCAEDKGYSQSSSRTPLMSKCMVKTLIAECNQRQVIDVDHKPYQASSVVQESLDFDDGMDEELSSFMDESFPL